MVSRDAGFLIPSITRSPSTSVTPITTHHFHYHSSPHQSLPTTTTHHFQSSPIFICRLPSSLITIHYPIITHHPLIIPSCHPSPLITLSSSFTTQHLSSAITTIIIHLHYSHHPPITTYYHTFPSPLIITHHYHHPSSPIMTHNPHHIYHHPLPTIFRPPTSPTTRRSDRSADLKVTGQSVFLFDLIGEAISLLMIVLIMIVRIMIIIVMA